MDRKLEALTVVPGGARPRRRALGRRRGALGAGLWLCVQLGLIGCEGCSRDAEPSGPANAGAARLTPEQASQVLARVGERTITLGDYANALERMDPFERMRYQTQDRRQALLDEMINVELLAREAERRGLDRQPQTLELIRQYQRDEVLRRVRAGVPDPSELPEADVAHYYREHREEFREPEHRRAAHLVFTQAKPAERALAEARGVDADGWRALVHQYGNTGTSKNADELVDPLPAGQLAGSENPPIDVPGDLGMFSAEASEPPAADEPLRQAVFRIPAVGAVLDEVVPHAGKFYVLRLVSKIEARQRTLAEADAAIRSRLVQELQARAEAELIERLRRSTQVSIDEAELERIAPPQTAPSPGH